MFRAASGRLFRVPLVAAGLLAPWLLAGCASGGASPLTGVLSDTLGASDDDARLAEATPFASLVLDTGDRSGLVVLGAASEPDTFWPTGNEGLISLRHGGLQATAGLEEDLLATRYRRNGEAIAVPWQQPTPAPFTLTRTWEDADGLTRTRQARGRLACAPAQERELPLATLKLEPCALTLEWQGGSTTEGTLWREPTSRRLWAVEEQAWPDGPEIRWEVARQWW
ncbi:hypothetical protein P1P91_15045 [Halomonas piscis]|uniref:YjbF family lipoprotein n=1 Tax=Halomonas piscis TaxID=3031727 RepID=A0ABY9Z088_9GAMM|nr:hypothetical protein [Halomonas piscis]WNK20105.1 hypothetical protein P1P91_15045 [Halomonas piscis]